MTADPPRGGSRARAPAHVLTVAANCLERDGHNPKLIEDIRAMAAVAAESQGEFYRADDEKRIERQRTLFAMVQDSHAKDRLEEAMLQRAYDLMCDGLPVAADAIAEFLPSDKVERVYDAWLDDQNTRGEKSKWY
jgi:hypothetical protein